MADKPGFVPEPGEALPWDVKRAEIGGNIAGDEEIVKKAWTNLDEYAYSFIWWFVQR